MKFLVMWSVSPGVPRTDALMKAVFRQADYVQKLEGKHLIEKHYHIVGRHGGVWIFDVSSNNELERLLAGSPLYNYSEYEVSPLSDERRTRE